MNTGEVITAAIIVVLVSAGIFGIGSCIHREKKEEAEAKQKANDDERKFKENCCKEAREQPVLQVAELRKYRGFTVVRKYLNDNETGILVLGYGDKLISRRVTHEVFAFVGNGWMLEPLVLLLEQSGPDPERLTDLRPESLPRLTFTQLSTTHGIVRGKVMRLCHIQNVIAIEVNGVMLFFHADDDTYAAVDIGTELPLKK